MFIDEFSYESLDASFSFESPLTLFYCFSFSTIFSLNIVVIVNKKKNLEKGMKVFKFMNVETKTTKKT